MFNFKRNFWGYRPDDVEQYFMELKVEHKVELDKKLAELNIIEEKNEKIKSKINTVLEEIENQDQKKSEVICSFVTKLNNIEEILIKGYDDARKNKLLALDKMQKKVDELENWDKTLKQCHADLLTMVKKYQLTNEHSKKRIGD